MIKANRILSTIVTLVMLQLSALAQFTGASHTTAGIVLEKATIRPGEALRGAIHLKMEKDWHTYWLFAGDVGLATTVEWTLPDGWKAEPLQFPPPKLINTSGLISYAYEDEVYLPFVLKPDPDGAISSGPVEVEAKISWLECKESCVPAEASEMFGFNISSNSLDSKDAKLVRDAFARLPSKLEGVHAYRDGAKLLVKIPQGLGLTDSSFFFYPDSAEQIVLAAPQKLAVDTQDGTSVLELEAYGEAKEPLKTLSGVLTAQADGQETSYTVQIELAEANALPLEQKKDTASLATVVATMLLAFLGGLILNLMPCVFPVLSLKILGIVEQSHQEGRKAWHHGVVFSIGVLVSFWLISGLLLVARSAGAKVGWGFQLQNPVVIASLAALFLIIALNLFGVFEVGENFTKVSNVAAKKQGFAGSFWSGVLTTVAATPCTAPFMGGAMGFALAQPTLVAILIFTSLALGVSAPYMTLTMFPKLLAKLPKPGEWMVTFKQLLAFPMLLASIWLCWVFSGQVGSDRMALLLVALLTVSIAAWVYGRFGASFNKTVRLRATAASIIILTAAFSIAYQASQDHKVNEEWQAYSSDLVDELIKKGTPVFLDFTADWCTSCKANELMALSRPEVQGKFKELGVTLVKGDWTKQDPAITRALQKFGRAGVPLYVLYPGEGKKPVVLPEILFPSTVLKALDSVSKK